MLKNRTVFLVSPEGWDFVFVSKHHYAIELSKRGNKVYFVNPPVQTVNGWICIRPIAEFPGLFVVDYCETIRGKRFLPSFLRNWLDRRFLKQIEKHAQVRFDLIWNFENSRFFDFHFAGAQSDKIYFQVDADQDFHPGKAASSADLVLAINSQIYGSLQPFNDNCHLVSHAYQGVLSDQAERVLSGEYQYQPADPTIQVMYVGNLDHGHVNLDLFESLIKKNGAIQFNLIGPYDVTSPLFTRLRYYSNVLFLGKVAFSEIPSFLEKADALILVYDDRFTQSSHKLLEYLASGKVIVSTYMKEYDVPNPLICMTRSGEEYLIAFQEVVENLRDYNSLEEMRRRIRFALENTYSRQLDRIQDLLEKRSKKIFVRSGL